MIPIRVGKEHFTFQRITNLIKRNIIFKSSKYSLKMFY